MRVSQAWLFAPTHAAVPGASLSPHLLVWLCAWGTAGTPPIREHGPRAGCQGGPADRRPVPGPEPRGQRPRRTAPGLGPRLPSPHRSSAPGGQRRPTRAGSRWGCSGPPRGPPSVLTVSRLPGQPLLGPPSATGLALLPALPGPQEGVGAPARARPAAPDQPHLAPLPGSGQEPGQSTSTCRRAGGEGQGERGTAPQVPPPLTQWKLTLRGPDCLGRPPQAHAEGPWGTAAEPCLAAGACGQCTHEVRVSEGTPAPPLPRVPLAHGNAPQPSSLPRPPPFYTARSLSRAKKSGRGPTR